MQLIKHHGTVHALDARTHQNVSYRATRWADLAARYAPALNELTTWTYAPEMAFRHVRKHWKKYAAGQLLGMALASYLIKRHRLACVQMGGYC